MTEITESVDKAVLPEAGAKRCLGTAAQSKNGPQIKVVKLYLGLFALGFDAINSRRFGLSAGQRSGRPQFRPSAFLKLAAPSIRACASSRDISGSKLLMTPPRPTILGSDSVTANLAW